MVAATIYELELAISRGFSLSLSCTYLDATPTALRMFPTAI